MTELLMDRLIGGLTPVRPRRLWHEIALLGLLALAQAVLLARLGLLRHDFGPGMAALQVWKIAGPACVAVVATVIALRGGDPAGARVGAWAIGAVGGAMLAVGGALVILTPICLPDAPRPAQGMACVLMATLLACPPALALGLMLRRAAPARPRQVALAAALAAGAFGATLLGLHCPDDHALHSLLWHPLGILLPGLLAALPIARAIRW